MPRKSSSQEMTSEERIILILFIIFIVGVLIYTAISPYLLIVGLTVLLVIVVGAVLLVNRFGVTGSVKLIIDTVANQRKRLDDYKRPKEISTPSRMNVSTTYSKPPPVQPAMKLTNANTQVSSTPKETTSVFYSPILAQVLDAIDKYTPPRRRNLDEQSYKDGLVGFLQAKGVGNLRTEVGVGTGYVDIVIGDNEIGIEVKAPYRKAELDRLYGQSASYAKYFKNLIILIYNQGVNPQDIQEFEEKVKHQDLLLREKASVIVR